MGKGFDTFMENPYWRKVYEEAPGEALKEYYRIRFDMSGFVMGEQYRDEDGERSLEELPLSKRDIEYLREHAGSGMARAYYQKYIERLSGEYEGRRFPAAAFQAEEWNPWYDAGLIPRTETEQ